MTNAVKAMDVVKLRSGGPSMTVSNVAEDTFGTMTAWCNWFDAKGTAQNGAFPVNVLEVVQSGPKNLSVPDSGAV